MSFITDAIDKLRAQWNDAIAQFYQAVTELDFAESQLYAYQQQASLDPDDWKEWQAQFSKVNAAKSTAERLQTIAVNVSNGWQGVKDTFGISGRRGIAGHLGLAPLVAPVIAGMTVTAFLVYVGTISAVAAAVGAFITYLNAKNEYVDYVPKRVDELIGQGVPADRASQIALSEVRTIAQQSTGYTFTSEITKTIMWVALGLGAVFVVPKLMGHRR